MVNPRRGVLEYDQLGNSESLGADTQSSDDEVRAFDHQGVPVEQTGDVEPRTPGEKRGDMVRRAIKVVMQWEEAGTPEGAAAALAATARLLAVDPNGVEQLHLHGLALHLLGR